MTRESFFVDAGGEREEKRRREREREGEGEEKGALAWRLCLLPHFSLSCHPGLLAPEPPPKGCYTTALWTPACRGVAP